MASSELNVVTGAFGYTGKYITRRLLSLGKRVRTLTAHPARHNPFGNRVDVVPFNFDRSDVLVESLRGATALYNTYWIRFSYGDVTFDRAVENTKRLLKAAEQAGVERIVHLSITNPTEDSPLPYFREKALLERAIIESSLSYAIIRPTVIFGREDILINNIVWLLRRLPVFGVPGSGDYRLQPVFVEDVADIAVSAGQQDDNLITDAVGPEVYTFDKLVRTIAHHVGSRAKIIHVPPAASLVVSRLIGCAIGDVLLTRDELDGLMSNLLVSRSSPTGRTRFSDWLKEHAESLGMDYASELDRHYRGGL